MKRKAVYAGSFDPLHLGHEWMIKKGSELFDELIILLAENPKKKPMFCLKERILFLEEIAGQYNNVGVDTLESGDFTVNYAADQGCSFCLRGIRNEQDFNYEQTMAFANSDINNKVTTIFLSPPRGELSVISSSLIKELIKQGGCKELIGKMVSPKVIGVIR